MSKVYRGMGKGYPVLVVGVLLVLVGGHRAVAREPPQVHESTSRVQRIVDRLRERFEIPEAVRVELVADNPRIASVQRSKEHRGLFLLSIQQSFLARLDDDEVEAMVAHELGHVWIFTHHPYLQTEQLANRIAMRHVTRERLSQVYGKVWGAAALTDGLTSFLGVTAETAAGEGTSPR
jgi:hypothetical protein